MSWTVTQTENAIVLHTRYRCVGSQVPELPEEEHFLDPTRYKSVLCRNWIEQNDCPYGARCVYAHGSAELRTVQHNVLALATLAFLRDHRDHKSSASGSTSVLTPLPPCPPLLPKSQQ
eukprot:TRINITY_DN65471_c0_g1_i1.p1 TRINITY_DN65471_c0_g1~~TRINITY_DN65471_c0_g1_i1.p1  ORF type:complete len:130 (+),score=10.96 TRINITY_DN65471_c0_g1_i1:39-392(+)